MSEKQLTNERLEELAARFSIKPKNTVNRDTQKAIIELLDLRNKMEQVREGFAQLQESSEKYDGGCMKILGAIGEDK